MEDLHIVAFKWMAYSWGKVDMDIHMHTHMYVYKTLEHREMYKVEIRSVVIRALSAY